MFADELYRADGQDLFALYEYKTVFDICIRIASVEREGIDFAVSMLPNNLEIFCLSILPGTELFDRADFL